MKLQQRFGIPAFVIIAALLIAACSPAPPEPPVAQAEAIEQGQDGGQVTEKSEAEEHGAADEHNDDAEHDAADEHSEGGVHAPQDHMSGMSHGVPEEAAAIPNPIEATEESIVAGAEIYATNCAMCHGQTGEGDGPAAAALEKPPANLHAGHVQANSDGALFYIISHGRPDTPMPAWDKVLTEEQRWQVVNYLRTFNDGDADEHAAGEHDAEDEHSE